MTTTGFSFANGQSSLSYGGITVLNQPPVVVPEGTPLMVATPSGFDYSFTAGMPYGSRPVVPDAVSVVTNSSTTQSVVGVGYFSTHAFYIDFTAHTEAGSEPSGTLTVSPPGARRA